MINVSKGYGNPGTAGFRMVLDHLNLEVSAGESIAIVGPSGSGKTTALNIIGTLDYPDEGQLIFNGKDMTRYSLQELAVFRNRELGFIFQMHFLLPQLTLIENVLLPVLPYRKNASPEDLKRAEFLIRKVGIWEQRFQKPSELSGGECQRTAVVRALINKPALLLADEPTGALDHENAEILSDLLLSLSREEGITLITVTHSQQLARRMEKIYDLIDGKIKRSR